MKYISLVVTRSDPNASAKILDIFTDGANLPDSQIEELYILFSQQHYMEPATHNEMDKLGWKYVATTPREFGRGNDKFNGEFYVVEQIVTYSKE